MNFDPQQPPPPQPTKKTPQTFVHLGFTKTNLKNMSYAQ